MESSRKRSTAAYLTAVVVGGGRLLAAGVLASVLLRMGSRYSRSSHAASHDKREKGESNHLTHGSHPRSAATATRPPTATIRDAQLQSLLSQACAGMGWKA